MKRQFLAMRNVRKQLLLRGSINASLTQITSTGIEQATRTLFAQAVKAIGSGPFPQDSLNELDNLRPQKLAEAVRTALGSLSELAQPDLDLGQLVKRLETLTALEAGTMSRVARDAGRAADGAIHDAARKFRETVESAFFARPTDAQQVVGQCRIGPFFKEPLVVQAPLVLQ